MARSFCEKAIVATRRERKQLRRKTGCRSGRKRRRGAKFARKANSSASNHSI